MKPARISNLRPNIKLALLFTGVGLILYLLVSFVLTTAPLDSSAQKQLSQRKQYSSKVLANGLTADTRIEALSSLVIGERQALSRKANEEVKLSPQSTESGSPCYSSSRDFTQKPITVHGWFGEGPIQHQCDIPCAGGGKIPDASRGTSHQRGACPLQYSYTMENVPFLEGRMDVMGTTSFESDLPMPYMSWEEYDYMTPAIKKDAEALVAAFISNCGPQKRLQWLSELQNYGVKVHSFGRCGRNVDIDTIGGNWLNKKNEVTRHYKFTFSFENSNAYDYVTEKLFGSFVAGSVPIYEGAPNARDFEISNRSVIYADEFEGPKELAEYLLKLDQDDEAYNSYLTWKTTGPSLKFIMLTDFAQVHSQCRLCIRVADIYRKRFGDVKNQGPWHEQNTEQAQLLGEDPDLTLVRVRERGKFWLRDIYIANNSGADDLYTAITERYSDMVEKFPIYSVYNLWDRKHSNITTDQQLQEFLKTDKNHEIEVVFVDEGSQNRASYSQWYNKNKANM